MKYIHNFSLLLIVVGLLSSCDALDLYPEDYYGTEDFWQNSAQVEGYMIGLHSNLRDKYQTFYILGEARGGTSKSGTSFIGTSINESSPIKTNTFSKHLTGVFNWDGLYSNILNVNLFIQKVEQECDFLEQHSRSYLLAQAYGLRAFYYFHLYKTFGGLPIIEQPRIMKGVTNAEDLYLKRSSAKVTLDFIKRDIEKSEELFGIDNTMKKEKSMWSRYATLMLKTEIYLWSAKVKTENQLPDMNDIHTAEQALLKVIGKFSLLYLSQNIFESIIRICFLLFS